MGMRILVPLEMYSSKSLMGTSMTNFLLDMARNTVGRTYWYLVVPPKDSEFIVPDVNLPNVEYLPYGPNKPFLGSYAPVDRELLTYFVKNRSDLPFDTILNLKYCNTMEIKLALTQRPDRWTCETEMPISTFYYESGVDKSLPYLSTKYGIMSVLSSLVCGSIIVFGAQDVEFVQEQARNYLSSSMVRKVLSGVPVVRPSVDWSLIDNKREVYDQARKERRERGQIHLFHGGTFEAKRHIPEIVELTEELHQLGMPVKLILKTQWDKDSKGFARDRVDVELEVDRPRFLDSFGQGDILICAPDYEGTGLSYMEAVRSGMVGVFLERPWIRERLPKDYPFVASSVAGMSKLVWTIYKNPEMAREVTDKLISYWDSLYSGKENANHLLTALQKDIENTWSQDRQKIKKFFYFEPIEKFCENAPDRFEWSQFLKDVRNYARSKEMNPTTFGISYLRRAIQECGFTDECAGPEFSFRRIVL